MRERKSPVIATTTHSHPRQDFLSGKGNTRPYGLGVRLATDRGLDLRINTLKKRGGGGIGKEKHCFQPAFGTIHHSAGD